MTELTLSELAEFAESLPDHARFVGRIQNGLIESLQVIPEDACIVSGTVVREALHQSNAIAKRMQVLLGEASPTVLEEVTL